MIPISKKEIKVEKNENGFVVGESPKLVINLKTEEHFIVMGERKIPYRNQIAFSEDLLRGKRQAVLETAIRYHYEKACEIAQNMVKAEEYRKQLLKERKNL